MEIKTFNKLYWLPFAVNYGLTFILLIILMIMVEKGNPGQTVYLIPCEGLVVLLALYINKKVCKMNSKACDEYCKKSLKNAHRDLIWNQ